MCLYPRLYINKKYTATKKNGGCIPELPIKGYEIQEVPIYEKGKDTKFKNAYTKIGTDKIKVPIYDFRVQHIEIPCGQCIECRESKAREWQVRLTEEIKQHEYNYFITLTFAPKELETICNKTHLKESNAIAGYAVRHMLERWRKDNKKSLKHWLITELGHEGTERIHLHGIIFSDKPLEYGEVDDNNLRTWKYWRYGNIYVGEYVNNKTINYISKYITKIDTDHKGFVGQILASPGIGKSFITKYQERNGQEYKYRRKDIADYYRLENGCKVKLPKYYKNKLYNEEQREEIWRDFMDKNIKSILGIEHKLTTTPGRSIMTIEENAKNKNKELGYGDQSKEWRKKEYNITRRMVQQIERNKRIEEMKKALNMPTLGRK